MSCIADTSVIRLPSKRPAGDNATWPGHGKEVECMKFGVRRRLSPRAIMVPATVLLIGMAYAKPTAAATMESTAKAFLDSLYPEQREKASFKIDDDERFNWFYTPVPRKGLPL